MLLGDKQITEMQLGKDEIELCKKLEHIYKKNGITNKSPTGMFHACKSLMQSNCKKDKYSIAQMAHSFRETLYPLWSKSNKLKNSSEKRKGVAIKEGGAVHSAEEINKRIGKIYGTLNRMAHHEYEFGEGDNCFEEFKKTFENFKIALKDILQNQVDIHKQIDEIL